MRNWPQEGQLPERPGALDVGPEATRIVRTSWPRYSTFVDCQSWPDTSTICRLRAPSTDPLVRKGKRHASALLAVVGQHVTGHHRTAHRGLSHFTTGSLPCTAGKREYPIDAMRCMPRHAVMAAAAPRVQPAHAVLQADFDAFMSSAMVVGTPAAETPPHLLSRPRAEREERLPW